MKKMTRREIRHKFRHGPGSMAHFNKQLEEQAGCCAICQSVMTFVCQDHDHHCCPPKFTSTGKLYSNSCGNCNRGLLCRACNSRLGFIEDLVLDNQNMVVKNKWIDKAREYVLAWSKSKIMRSRLLNRMEE
jgi:hypothetical protein